MARVHILCVHVKELRRLQEMSVYKICRSAKRLQGNGGVYVRDAHREEELKRALDGGRCRQGGSLEFIESKTWWSGDNHTIDKEYLSYTYGHTDRFTYIAMVEEFSKAGVRVGAHLNAVAPVKMECVGGWQVSLCCLLNLTFEV